MNTQKDYVDDDVSVLTVQQHGAVLCAQAEADGTEV